MWASSGAGSAGGARPFRAAIVNRVLPAHATPKDLGAALREVGAADALVLWLRPGDLSALEKVRPTSGCGFPGKWRARAAPLPASWRAAARMAYPVDLPGRRVVRVDYALSWFRIRKIPLLAQQVAGGHVSRLWTGVGDSESYGGCVRAGVSDRARGNGTRSRALTGYYPRLTLAPGQRFASKGGYIVRFSDPQDRGSPRSATDHA